MFLTFIKLLLNLSPIKREQDGDSEPLADFGICRALSLPFWVRNQIQNKTQTSYRPNEISPFLLLVLDSGVQMWAQVGSPFLSPWIGFTFCAEAKLDSCRPSSHGHTVYWVAQLVEQTRPHPPPPNSEFILSLPVTGKRVSLGMPSHTIKFSLLKCIVVWLVEYSQNCAAITTI